MASGVEDQALEMVLRECRVRLKRLCVAKRIRETLGLDVEEVERLITLQEIRIETLEYRRMDKCG